MKVSRPGVGIAVIAVSMSVGLAGPTSAQYQPAHRVAEKVLNSISATSATDVWAVGYISAHQFGVDTLIRHFDGTAWSRVPSPTGGYYTSLLGVDARSSTDAWAVGQFQDTSDGPTTPLIEHWDGSAWTIVPSADPTQIGGLESVAIISANDVWAVGSTYDGETHAYIEHWDGSVWTEVPSTGEFLWSVSGAASNDVWAVNRTGDGADDLLHWNGSAWSHVTQPPSRLTGVSAVSTNDVWVVGAKPDYNGTFTRHWDGTSWTTVPSPNAPGDGSQFMAVSASSSTDAWAVGTYRAPNKIWRTLLEHWDGTAWSIAKSRNPDRQHATAAFTSVTATGSNAWGVGTVQNSGARPFIQVLEP